MSYLNDILGFYLKSILCRCEESRLLYFLIEHRDDVAISLFTLKIYGIASQKDARKDILGTYNTVPY